MELEIRRAKESDLQAILELMHNLFLEDGKDDKYLKYDWPYQEGEDYFKNKITDSNSITLIAQSNEKAIGLLSGSLMEIESFRPVKRAELEEMYVLEEFRSQKIGEKLVDEFKNWSKGKEAEIMMVKTYAGSKRAIHFYEKCGFKPYYIALESKI